MPLLMNYYNLFSFTFFLFISLFPKLSCEECIYPINCEQNLKDNCVTVTNTESAGYYKISFNPCHNQRSHTCNVYEAMLDISSTPSSKCRLRQSPLPSYIGGSCLKELDCLYGKCIGRICRDATEGQECFMDESCPIGTACILNVETQISTCQKPKGLNEQCIKSTDCAFNLVCYNFKCREMFSLNSASFLSSKIDKGLALLCKSGQALFYQGRYNCVSLYNVKRTFNDKCIDDCEYIYDNEKTIKVLGSCSCGFNYERSKHCVLGSGEDAYVAFIQAKKALWNDPSYIKHCHITEKFSDKICNGYINNEQSLTGRRNIQNYNNLKIEALDHHRLINTDECIKTVVFDYQTLAVLPEKQTCASYSCDSDLNTCAAGTNPLNEDGKNLKIILNDGVCVGKQGCVFPNDMKIDAIYENKEIKGECSDTVLGEDFRLPGEECAIGKECFSGKCNVNEHKCEGSGINEKCSNHDDCIVGLSCWKGTCQKQKKEGEECMTGWDCLNYLGCYATVATTVGKCTQLGLVGDINVKAIKDKWTVFPDIHHNYNPSIIGTSLMCKNGQLSVTQARCGEYRYDTDIEAMKHENEDHFIECEYESYCYYIDNYNKKMKKKCECGYNSHGKGYCPLPNSINKEDWILLNKLKQEETENKCHTLSRFNCYSNPKSSDISEVEFRTTKAHLFYKAVPCAYKVLSSSILSLSNSTILILILLIY